MCHLDRSEQTVRHVTCPIQIRILCRGHSSEVCFVVDFEREGTRTEEKPHELVCAEVDETAFDDVANSTEVFESGQDCPIRRGGGNIVDHYFCGGSHVHL